MKLTIHSDIDLDGPNAGRGYCTWLDVRAGDDREQYASARVALLHVGEIADAHGDLWPALHRTRLEPLHDVYFSQGWYRDEYADGAGIDLLYVDSLTIADPTRRRNLDLAIVRRLCDTFGSGCQLAVMAYRDAHEAGHWSRLGFSPSTPGRMTGLMHMKLGYRHARIVDSTGTGDFEVIATDITAPRMQSN
ncbi:hypothetical protein AKJ09_04784 [Labilithrix luteola]|uniref:Histone acetyltransferase HPA2 n=1 Tax=Labilithrix luteola TaxID=1391654 RepID=A0A0K1PX59_9BACT|nr:hypothetical protein [Labilithrix luteola]AKU98120.1 hypothetical protein AKJ09_04784 [Labilithrix luteola]